MDYLESSYADSAGAGHGHGLAAASASSSSVASRLYASGQQRNSRRNSFSSDAPGGGDAGELLSFNDVSDFSHSFNEANNEISKMSQRLRELQDLQLSAAEEKSRLKTENAVMQERIHLYEEQLQTTEQTWTKRLEEEKLRVRDTLARVTREKELEAEKDALRYQVLEGQLKAAQREKERAEEQARDWQSKANTLRDQLHDLQADCERVESEKRKLKAEFERYQLDTLDRMENNAEILEELTRQSDHIRSYPRQGSLTDQIMTLEDEVEQLKAENRELREQNRDLQAQILHDSVECGRSLLAGGDSAPSLAAELGGMDSQGLMNALREQELVNQRLRNYVNGILMRIIERHPDILEIKDPTAANNDNNNANNGCASTQNESKSQPVSPPPSGNTVNSSLQRSSGERLSLRYLWYGSKDNNSAGDNKNTTNNNKNSHCEESGGGDDAGTVPETFAKRLYHSLVGQEWNLFSRTTNSGFVEPPSSAAASPRSTNVSVETVIAVNEKEAPPPDPTPTVAAVTVDDMPKTKVAPDDKSSDKLTAEKQAAAERCAQRDIYA